MHLISFSWCLITGNPCRVATSLSTIVESAPESRRAFTILCDYHLKC